MMPQVGDQLRRFLIVGAGTVAIDFVTYALCLEAGLWISVAKATGFVVGTFAAYLANRFWTFAGTAAQGSLRGFLLLYLATLAVNVAVNAAMVAWLGESWAALGFAFVVATAVSAGLNFLGLKFYVFRG
jgi:putative flippase GtrA